MVPHFTNEHAAGMWWAVFGPLHFLMLVAVFVALRSLYGAFKGNANQSPALTIGLCLNAVLLTGLVGAFLVFGMAHPGVLGR